MNMSRIPKDKPDVAVEEPPMLVNAPVNGSKVFVTDGERSILMAKQIEIDEARRKIAERQREISFLTVDVYRKSDELTEKIKELTEKYGLKKGERELDLRTGEIVSAKK